MRGGLVRQAGVEVGVVGVVMGVVSLGLVVSALAVGVAVVVVAVMLVGMGRRLHVLVGVRVRVHGVVDPLLLT